jgi:hypothetical protein
VRSAGVALRSWQLCGWCRCSAPGFMSRMGGHGSPVDGTNSPCMDTFVTVGIPSGTTSFASGAHHGGCGVTDLLAMPSSDVFPTQTIAERRVTSILFADLVGGPTTRKICSMSPVPPSVIWGPCAGSPRSTTSRLAPG